MRVSRSRPEQWAPVPGLESRYLVSTFGNVMSFPTARRTWAKTLKASIKKRGAGYRQFTLVRQDGRLWYVNASRLVLLTFVGPCPEGMEVCHRNGRSLDDRLSNLRWGTHVSNIEDKRAHGTLRIGTQHPQAVMTDNRVRQLRALRLRGVSNVAVARMFGVHPTTASNINLRQTWRHI